MIAVRQQVEAERLEPHRFLAHDAVGPRVVLLDALADARHPARSRRAGATGDCAAAVRTATDKRGEQGDRQRAHDGQGNRSARVGNGNCRRRSVERHARRVADCRSRPRTQEYPTAFPTDCSGARGVRRSRFCDPAIRFSLRRLTFCGKIPGYEKLTRRSCRADSRTGSRIVHRDRAAGAAGRRRQGRGAAAPPQPMSFFITSVGKGDGANYGGLAGADAYCQQLGTAAGRGAPVVWHAYLSTQGPGAVNARDRIGNGPWFNARGGRIGEQRRRAPRRHDRAGAHRQRARQADLADREEHASSTASATCRTSTTS